MRTRNMKKSVFALALSFVFLISGFTNAFGAGVVTVNLDGKVLTYTEAQPQIIDSRTMVPLRETAAHFGMSFTWDAETGTMTCYGDGITFKHTVKTNVVIVNGVSKQFDFSSAIVNDRTLMPVRMMAEALNSKIEFVEATTTVNITSNQAAQPPVATTPNSGSIQALSNVYSATLAKKTINLGDSVVVNVSANKATTMVKVTDTDGNELGEATSPKTTDTEGNYFEVSITPKKQGELSLKAYGGSTTGYTTSFKTLTLTVEDETESMEITKVTPEQKYISADEEAIVIVRTSVNVVKVTVEDHKGKVLRTLKTPTDKYSSYYSWKLEFESEYTGTREFTVYAYDKDDKSIKQTFELEIDEKSSSSDRPKIISTTFDDSKTYSKDKKIDFQVKTNKGVRSVFIYNRYMEKVDYQTSYNKSDSGSSYYMWDIKFYPDEDGIYYIYAYDTDDEYSYNYSVDQKITIDFD